MDKREALEMLGGDTERFDEEQKKRDELEALAVQKKAFIDQMIGVFYDKNSRFAINKTARLYNASDIASFNIPVIEPGPTETTVPGFIPKLSNKDLREILKQSKGADVAFPVFADENCKENCVGFVICRGGSSFEILDSNPFGANEYNKDELYALFKGVRLKSSWINKATKSDEKLEISDVKELASSEDFMLLDDSMYDEDALRMKGMIVEMG
jgi:hypothetical protein